LSRDGIRVISARVVMRHKVGTELTTERLAAGITDPERKPVATVLEASEGEKP